MGSGTSAIAALAEGRHFIGIDKEEKYVQLADKSIERYKSEAAQMTIFDYGMTDQ